VVLEVEAELVAAVVATLVITHSAVLFNLLVVVEVALVLPAVAVHLSHKYPLVAEVVEFYQEQAAHLPSQFRLPAAGEPAAAVASDRAFCKTVLRMHLEAEAEVADGEHRVDLPELPPPPEAKEVQLIT
jgi:hypothetical protein